MKHRLDHVDPVTTSPVGVCIIISWLWHKGGGWFLNGSTAVEVFILPHWAGQPAACHLWSVGITCPACSGQVTAVGFPWCHLQLTHHFRRAREVQCSDGRGMLWVSLKCTYFYIIHSWGDLIKWFLVIHPSLFRQIFSVLVTVIKRNRSYRINILYIL